MTYTGDETKKGAISKLYKVLHYECNSNNKDVKEKWELEANIIICDEDWEETFKLGHSITNSPTWREFDSKVKKRYFNTPSITSKYSNTSNLCWRGCGRVGDFPHIFWDCPNIQGFWKDVQKQIKRVLGITFTLDPALYILGILPSEITLYTGYTAL